MKKVIALIPAYNEAENITRTLEAILTLDRIDKIIVINDGSHDDTAELVRQKKGIILIDLKENKGKGAALNLGWQTNSGDIYLLLDADLGTTASLAQHLLEPVLHGEADMTVARFDQQQTENTSGMGFGLVRRTACLGVQLLTGVTVTSPLSGQRAISAEVLEKLGCFFEGFGVEIGLTVGALFNGFRVLEVPLAMKHRAYGRGIKGIKHRGRQFIHVLRALWRCWQKGWRQ